MRPYSLGQPADVGRVVCQVCGFRTNADHNASRVIRDRGVALVLSGEFSPVGRKTMRIRTKVRAGRYEPGPIRSPTLGETSVRRQAVSRAQKSVNLPLPRYKPEALAAGGFT